MPNASPSGGCSFGQHMVDQTPSYGRRSKRRKPRRPAKATMKKVKFF